MWCWIVSLSPSKVRWRPRRPRQDPAEDVEIRGDALVQSRRVGARLLAEALEQEMALCQEKCPDELRSWSSNGHRHAVALAKLSQGVSWDENPVTRVLSPAERRFRHFWSVHYHMVADRYLVTFEFEQIVWFAPTPVQIQGLGDRRTACAFFDNLMPSSCKSLIESLQGRVLESCLQESSPVALHMLAPHLLLMQLGLLQPLAVLDALVSAWWKLCCQRRESTGVIPLCPFQAPSI